MSVRDGHCAEVADGAGVSKGIASAGLGRSNGTCGGMVTGAGMGNGVAKTSGMFARAGMGSFGIVGAGPSAGIGVDVASKFFTNAASTIGDGAADGFSMLIGIRTGIADGLGSGFPAGNGNLRTGACTGIRAGLGVGKR